MCQYSIVPKKTADLAARVFPVSHHHSPLDEQPESPLETGGLKYNVSKHIENLFKDIDSFFTFNIFQENFHSPSGVGKCPNWTSPNHWGYNLQQIWEGDVKQIPKKGHQSQPLTISNIQHGISLQDFLMTGLSPGSREWPVVSLQGLADHSGGFQKWRYPNSWMV